MNPVILSVAYHPILYRFYKEVFTFECGFGPEVLLHPTKFKNEPKETRVLQLLQQNEVEKKLRHSFSIHCECNQSVIQQFKI
jgi:hypothetical protein